MLAPAAAELKSAQLLKACIEPSSPLAASLQTRAHLADIISHLAKMGQDVHESAAFCGSSVVMRAFGIWPLTEAVPKGRSCCSSTALDQRP